jgi:hypothetical protein
MLNTVLRDRRIVHTGALDFLHGSGLDSNYPHMPHKATRKTRIENLVKEAAKPYPALWWEDDRLNFEALARHFSDRGRTIPSATLYRICKGLHAQPSERLVEAFNYVLRIPKELLRGEALTSEMSKAFGDYKLSTLILAEKLEELPRADYARIVEEIDSILERDRRLREALESENVTHIDKHRRR